LLLPWFGVACALLVVAGAAKLRSPAGARGALRAVGLTVPNAAVRTLGGVEIAIGAWAVLRPAALTGALVAALYGGFTAFVVAAMRARDSAPCGCFGAAETELGPVHAALNAVACAVGVAVAIAPPHGIGWMVGQSPLIAAALALGVAGAAYAAYLAFTAFPDAWRAYGEGQR
jgi:Methylamine utilisation protein MauE